MYTEALTRCWWKGRTVWESKVSNGSRVEIYCTSPLPWEQLSPLCNDSRSEQMAIPVLINLSVQHSHSLREREGGVRPTGGERKITEKQLPKRYQFLTKWLQASSSLTVQHYTLHPCNIHVDYFVY